MEKIKLDLIDRKILAELDKNCRIPNSKLGKKIGRSRETVKYRIQHLQKKGIIERFITSINPNKLGFYMFKVYLQLDNIQKERKRFYNYLKSQKNIYWMGISDGAFDCVFAILSKSITDYYDQINKILSEFKNLIVRKVLGVMVDTRQYNKRFLTNDKDGKFVIFGGDVINNEIDETDYQILNILANNARISLAELARKVNSTIEIVRGKIKKMKEKRIILGYRIAVNFNKLDLEFYKAIIYFKSLSLEEEKALFEWMRTNPSSLYYIRSLAPWGAELEFAVESYQYFNQIMNDLRKKFPNVIRNHEHLIMIYETWLPSFKEILKPRK